MKAPWPSTLMALTPALLAGVATAAWAEPVEPAKSLAPLAAGGVAQMFIGLAVVLALIAGAAWLLRRFAPLRAGDNAIQVVGALNLSARERLLLVRVDGTRLLIGVAPGRVQTLHVLPPAASDFAARLDAANQERSHE